MQRWMQGTTQKQKKNIFDSTSVDSPILPICSSNNLFPNLVGLGHQKCFHKYFGEKGESCKTDPRWVWQNIISDIDNTMKPFYFLGISGGFEAGLQLTLTSWLLLRKVISIENFLNVTWTMGSYGNFFPSIPLISAASSLLTMITTCIRWIVNVGCAVIILNSITSRLNLPLPYEAYPKKDFFERYNKQSAQILGFLSHFVFSCLFRVSCLAFMWIYLAFYATIPILVLLFINILIFYILESDKGKFIDVEVFNFCYLGLETLT